MSTSTDTPLTPAQRLSRGLRYTVVGPVDITRGTVGLGASSAASGVSWLSARLRPEPPAPPKRRPLLYVVIGAGVLAIGAVTFSIVRRSMRPEPSTLPPSVEISPKP
ncbi:MAG: cell wall synthesis protein CwsA [Mycolicibacterium neoaurum]|uniref:cell wall synthesis protein CwsA n=1 Tax=Mycolicibacterium neoaurum TaxID=1795 RepID=UPI002FF94374